MRTTRYFREQVRRKRPYLQDDWLIATTAHPSATDIQEDGRVRYWRYIPELGRYLRVVTLTDGVTIHNPFPDRGFGGPPP